MCVSQRHSRNPQLWKEKKFDGVIDGQRRVYNRTGVGNRGKETESSSESVSPLFSARVPLRRRVDDATTKREGVNATLQGERKEFRSQPALFCRKIIIFIGTPCISACLWDWNLPLNDHLINFFYLPFTWMHHKSTNLILYLCIFWL